MLNPLCTVDKAATCTEEGSESIHCSVCDAIKDGSSRVIEKKEHQWKESYTVDKPATCTEEGSESIHCSVCDAIEENSSRPIQKKGHAYGAWKTTKKATELASGLKTHTCVNCGKEEAAKINQLKPSLPAVVVVNPTPEKKSATIKWKKISSANQKKITSLQIQYSMDKNFKKGVKTATAKKNTVSKKVSKLASKKIYYVRVRAYKKDKKGVHISKWSAVKAVRVK